MFISEGAAKKEFNKEIIGAGREEFNLSQRQALHSASLGVQVGACATSMLLFLVSKKVLLVGKLQVNGLEILNRFNPGDPFAMSKEFLYHPCPQLLEAAFFFNVAD